MTKARGDERSQPIVAAVVDEVNRAHASGVQEVVLAGVHLGGYGDIGCDLKTLVEQVLAQTAVPRGAPGVAGTRGTGGRLLVAVRQSATDASAPAAAERCRQRAAPDVAALPQRRLPGTGAAGASGGARVRDHH